MSDKLIRNSLVLRLVSIRRKFKAWREKFFVSRFSFMRAASAAQFTPNGNQPLDLLKVIAEYCWN